MDDKIKTQQALTKSEPTAKESFRNLTVDIPERPWWSRVWVVQETALSRELILRGGNDEISWPHFAKIVLLLGCAVARTTASLGMAFHPTSLGSIVKVLNIRSFTREGRPLILSQLVALNKLGFATDPRDLVLGLCGLALDSADPLLNPDYSVSNKPVDVFGRLIEHSIETHKRLDIICTSRPTKACLDIMDT